MKSKEEINEYYRKYRAEHKQQLKEYKQAHKEEIREYFKNYRANHLEDYRLSSRKYYYTKTKGSTRNVDIDTYRKKGVGLSFELFGKRVKDLTPVELKQYNTEFQRRKRLRIRKGL